MNLDFLHGIIDAAERCEAPVILSLAESHFEYFDLELLMAAVLQAARRASIPVAIHLDHGAGLDSAVRAVNLGCNGIMVDSSDQPLTENIHRTQQVVAMAGGCGVPVEGKLGYVPGVEGEDAERHPDHVAFADNLFRTVVGGRVSIDYQEVEPPLPAPETTLSTASR